MVTVKTVAPNLQSTVLINGVTCVGDEIEVKFNNKETIYFPNIGVMLEFVARVKEEPAMRLAIRTILEDYPTLVGCDQIVDWEFSV